MWSSIIINKYFSNNGFYNTEFALSLGGWWFESQPSHNEHINKKKKRTWYMLLRAWFLQCTKDREQTNNHRLATIVQPWWS